MKITFLTPADNLTGGTRVVATYASLLQRRGHEVLVVSNAPDRTTLRERLRATARSLRRGQWPRRAAPPAEGHIALSGVPHRVLERKRPIEAHDVPDADVVVATWWETAVWMHALPPRKGRPVHLVQGYEVWTGGAVRDRVHAALALPNRKVAISGTLAREIERELGPLDMTVVPNAVDLQRFDAPSRARGTPPTVGFIYAHTPIKGSDLCARACSLARERVPSLRVLAFGVDRPDAGVPLPAGTEFTWRPAQAQLPALYARCDAWLFGSRLDSFGLPLLEAMACRTPVIGVPTGAAPELLADGAGVLVPPESPEAMADAIVQLCAGPEADWRRTAQRAHARAHAYSWEDATTRLLDVLEAASAPDGGRA
ncbi:MAG: glycosyltransferase family 4 protein [Burkholderiaceae bacterium]|nr:glycosyltransferase family 4 protein [Rhodoferax sp.]MCP5284745.1 glycosyltransferase family 4 protein [Burkholderiaceae bacterium]